MPIPTGFIADAVYLYLDSNGNKYKHADTRIPISSLTPSDFTNGNDENKYFCRVGFEHAHNNYLSLLNTDTVKILKQ
ncbi:MAG: hypothetical protein JSS91_02735 [Bacteroidetes bacterium]|nr:hypothetical protein [Bacteroidota bacterium]